MESMRSDEEVQLPLLPESRQRMNSVTSFLQLKRNNVINSLTSGYGEIKKHRHGFLYFLFASCVIYLGFILIFLPRTSLSRDLRRLHSNKVTKDEMYRIYLDALLEKNEAQMHVRNYTKFDHLIGQTYNLNYTVNYMKYLGFSPKLERYYPWINEPVDSKVALWIDNNKNFSSNLSEDVLLEDPSTWNNYSTIAFHGYSATGNVTTQYVFCNYGTIEDYLYLVKNNIDLENKVHIIRYGLITSGLKVKHAENYGASAVILYTDPYEDGLITNKNGYLSYPNGPARQNSSIERGSVLYLTDFLGDPTTPGYASKDPNTPRISPKGRIPNIPSVPISTRDITVILKQLNGRGIQFDQKGNIDGFEYFSGPSHINTQVQVYNKQKYKIKEISNIIVEIPGILTRDEVIIGSHRDSLTINGAGSCGSGTAILLEIARGLSELCKVGWKPLKTIKLINWDGTEYGLLGSTEHAEYYKKKLTKNAIAYLNLDTAISGTKFQCETNPLLRNVFIKASRYTLFKRDPTLTLYDYWKSISGLNITTLGSDGDSLVFQNHLGISSANVYFGNDRLEDAIYQYHTNYDTYTWIEKFIDPEYNLHNTMAIFIGLSTLMLTGNEIIPFKTHDYMCVILKYYQKIHKLINLKFKSYLEIRVLSTELYNLLDFAAFDSSVNFDANIDSLREEITKDYPLWRFYKKIVIYVKLVSINLKLKKLDRLFIIEHGLKSRTWMKHSIYAPDKFFGYTENIFPGLHGALKSNNSVIMTESLRLMIKQLQNVVSLLTV